MGILRVDKLSGLETPTAVTGSVSFDGNDHLSIGNSGDFNFLHNGATDWTVEFWAKTGTATRQFVWGTGGSSAQTGFYLNIMSQADGQADATGIYAAVGRGASGNYINWGANDCLTLNTWHHIAAVFKSSDKTLALYVDGKEVDNDAGTVNGTFAAANYSSSNHSYAFTVGKNIHGNGNFMNGEISNLRVVAGRRLYTTDFTPPVHALETINGTRIICCNNPDSVTAMSNADIGTAHIVTASGDPTVATDNPSLTRDFTSGTEFKGVTTFDTQGYFVPPSGTTEQRGGTRGLRMGGNNASNVIEYYDISTIGNTQDFGDLSFTIKANAACSSSTRALSAGGEISGSGNTNHIDFVSIMSTGNAVTFGDLDPNSLDISHTTGLSNSTRGIFSGGYGSPGPFGHCDHMAFVTIAALGNGQDFGDLNYSTTNAGSFSSPTRGVIGGGQNPGFLNTIGFITIATTGSAQDFGDLTVARRTLVGGSNSVRGLFAGGQNTSPNTDANGVDTIDYVTIASTGNAQDFGNLSGKRLLMSAGTSSTRCVWPGGESVGNTANNAMEYVTIASTGDAIDFGDTITSGRFGPGGCSNGHGGIS